MLLYQGQSQDGLRGAPPTQERPLGILEEVLHVPKVVDPALGVVEPGLREGEHQGPLFFPLMSASTRSDE